MNTGEAFFWKKLIFNELFFLFSSLRIHFYDSHLSEDEKIYECEYCDKRFGLRTMRNKHVKQIHEKKHSCEYCGELVC